MADQGTEGFLSPFLRARRLGAAKPYLKGRILDFGAGSGALAALVRSQDYVGVEIDKNSIERARSSYPRHRFMSSLNDVEDAFDTVVSLAVIEHVADPVEFLRALVGRLKQTAESRIVVTTPHPSMDWVHDAGAAIGLFSKHANEEHEDLLDRSKLETAGKEAGLELVRYRRFLMGANQLAIYRRRQ